MSGVGVCGRLEEEGSLPPKKSRAMLSPKPLKLSPQPFDPVTLNPKP